MTKGDPKKPRISSLGSLRREAAMRIPPALPRPLRRKLVPDEYAWDYADLRPVARAKPGSSRLLIGRTNSASQATHWARAAETLDGVSAVSLAFGWNENSLQTPPDVVVPYAVGTHSEIWARKQRKAILAGFTHVLYEAEKPILAPLYNGDLVAEVQDLTSHGIQVALVCHGSDIRTPSTHASLEPYSPFSLPGQGLTAALEKVAETNHRLLDQLSLPTYVATPDLLDYRPDAAWLPTLADPERFAGLAPTQLGGRKLRVLHVPSRSLLKGTAHVSEAMRELERDGLIEYLEYHNVPHEQMPQLVETADLVIDQLGIGAYGVTSIEAMLAGRLAIAHVGESVRQFIGDRTGLELPIIEANQDTISAVVRHIAENPLSSRHLIDAGYDFTAAVHSPRAVAEALRPLFDA